MYCTRGVYQTDTMIKKTQQLWTISLGKVPVFILNAMNMLHIIGREVKTSEHSVCSNNVCRVQEIAQCIVINVFLVALDLF